jgi:N-terminal domain of reverse transcriptase
MGPEAKAPGKARGYADGAPEEQKVDASRTSQSSVSNQATPGMYVWEDLPWTKVERKVFKLQRRIYRASQRADTKTVHAFIGQEEWGVIPGCRHGKRRCSGDKEENAPTVDCIFGRGTWWRFTMKTKIMGITAVVTW